MELVAVPAELVTLIGPVVATAGTAAEICVLETTVNVAGVPLKMTAVAPVKPAPVIVTALPVGALAGEKEMMVGAACELTVNLALVAAVP